MSRTYFPGLNALRAYAALSVVVSHVVASSPQFDGSAHRWHWFDWLALSGWDAVTLFFVLSGFLITYLLLEERRHSGTVDLRGFYTRRALRILPLYYLAVVVGFAVIPALLPSAQTPTSSAFVWSLALLPQVSFAFAQDALGFMAHLWSIGVEEQVFWVDARGIIAVV